MFLFDNATNHFIYTKNVFQVKEMNKKIGKKQSWLCNKWFDYKNIEITHFMIFFNKKKEVTQKKV